MKKVNVRKVLSYLPEMSVLLVAICWFVDNLLGAFAVNGYALGMIGVMLALLIRRSRVLAVVLSVITGLGSVYMLLAVLSEFHEFPDGDPTGMQFLVTGGLIFISLGIMAVLMPWKYFRESN
ncbi:MAG: hypothetical protein LBS79_08360 [Tannerella sp.]|jgi:hypothetical protein|nr:hypothetical protein [Tannerella sp.]